MAEYYKMEKGWVPVIKITEKIMVRSILKRKTNSTDFNSGEANVNTVLAQQVRKRVNFADGKGSPLCQVFKISYAMNKSSLKKVNKSKNKACSCSIF